MTDQINEAARVKPKRRLGGWLTVFISIALVGGLAFVFYQFYNQVREENVLLTHRVEAIRSQVSQLETQSEALQQSIQSQHEADQTLNTVYEQLSTLNNSIDQLPLPNVQTAPKTTETITEEPVSLSWWQKGLRETWKSLKQIMVVRYYPEGVPPLVSPDTREFLYLNLHATMQKAMWALLMKNSSVYRASLEEATQWIKKYFVQEADATKTALNTLHDLQAVEWTSKSA